ncbi:MAG TPA: hypothetical protein VK470_17570 [Bacteroidota bacterium]|nr:hypothetical protein [Bacteroidota bacterium]
MKISSFQPMNINDARSESARQMAAAKKTQKPDGEAQAARESQRAETENASIMSREEKEYFASLYPEDSKKIISYSTYSKGGIAQAVSVGSLFDKKS